MTISNRRLAAAMVAAVVTAFVALAAPTVTHAQISVTNTSGCTILLTLVDAGGHLSGPYVIPSGGIATSIPTPPGYAPVGAEDINGRTRKFTGSSACTGCIPLPAQVAEICCVDVCFDSGAQTITISACSPCQ